MSGLFLFLVMHSFLEEIVEQINSEQVSLENTVFILPSRRAGTFLRNNIAKTKGKTIFSPEIYSIESFVENISGITYATNTQQLFELYYCYLEQGKEGQDSFIDFSKWGQTLLQDFNEIDRYLIDSEELLSNLSAIQEIDHWYVEVEKTQMIEDYIQFWNNLKGLYKRFNEKLLDKAKGHQGLVYREAYRNLESYLESNQDRTYIFIGFNALNSAESKIIQRILKIPDSQIYWDIDSYFLDDPVHDASFFIRTHLKNWGYLKKNELKGISSNFLAEKNIQVIGVPKNTSQAKYVGSLLKKLRLEKVSLQNTSVVLSDETLLNPLLNSIPSEIDKVNITMGYPLNKSPFHNFFMQFFELYHNKQPNGWYYKNVLSFVSDPFTSMLLTYDNINVGDEISKTIKSKNLTFLDIPHIIPLEKAKQEKLSLLFFQGTPSPKLFVECCLKIISELKIKLQVSKNALALEELFRFYGIFNQVLDLIQEHGFITDLKSLQALFQELLSSETLDFQGDPLEGLQIMGMLETRNLDFETVIITSVNEGILPSGKSNNSFIPYDLKRNFGLPTFKEKDAVYTYHFYRLLQRAKNIYLIYNTEPDVLEGGERSRLITQLLTDENINQNITECIAVPEIAPQPNTKMRIDKNDSLMALIQGHSRKGFSPTSLSNYIRNPIDFYKQNLLGINDFLDVEETIAANTFGTIIHDTLEDLYKPFIGSIINEELLLRAKTKVNELVKIHFSKTYSDATLLRGKNLIAFNVVINYVQNFIDLEIGTTKNHQIKILGLEQKLQLKLNLPELDFPILLKGKLDRIDEKDGVLRIIDYKSGKAMANQVEITDWPEITKDYNHSKAFQLLCYALMYHQKTSNDSIEAGIFSFKNLNAGLLSFAVKEKRNSRTKDKTITSKTLAQFTKELKKLILEICNPHIPFEEKEV